MCRISNNRNSTVLFHISDILYITPIRNNSNKKIKINMYTLKKNTKRFIKPYPLAVNRWIDCRERATTTSAVLHTLKAAQRSKIGSHLDLLTTIYEYLYDQSSIRLIFTMPKLITDLLRFRAATKRRKVALLQRLTIPHRKRGCSRIDLRRL